MKRVCEETGEIKPRGGSDIVPALRKIVRMQPRVEAIALLCDGDLGDVGECVAICREAEVCVFGVGWGCGEGDLAKLARLCRETGGLCKDGFSGKFVEL